jgi:hypothetical protein
MALIIGSVTVDENGDVTGTGLSKRLIDELLGMTAFASMLNDLAGDERKATMVQGMADFATAIATGVINEITANAEVTVTVSASDAGLQRMPASTTEDTPCKAPADSVELSTKGTVA